ncbi:hypothetical protein BaRGS_00003059 [Batillaria attramentaria]|uniref:Uncharacterized protein n=1 Tax=Batillaria attramentaria TaxID=370345 RepID=A0ABD0M3G5_9CAEN
MVGLFELQKAIIGALRACDIRLMYGSEKRIRSDSFCEPCLKEITLPGSILSPVDQLLAALPQALAMACLACCVQRDISSLAGACSAGSDLAITGVAPGLITLRHGQYMGILPYLSRIGRQCGFGRTSSRVISFSCFARVVFRV